MHSLNQTPFDSHTDSTHVEHMQLKGFQNPPQTPSEKKNMPKRGKGGRGGNISFLAVTKACKGTKVTQLRRTTIQSSPGYIESKWVLEGS